MLSSLSYAPLTGVYDEMLTPSHAMRPHWQSLADGLESLGQENITHRWERGQRLLRANGVTYTVYGSPEGRERPWQLDPFPLVIDEAEWAAIDQAIQQRAHLLNAILDDLYGEQRLVRQGLLPAAVVHANPAFWRPLVGMALPSGPRLHFYAADLARSPDGAWWVIGDRTEAPSGAGYALENRSVLSRMLPESYNDCSVRRLAPWFLKARASLEARSVSNRDDPRIVLLTPGVYNETWFEHAYLARILGLTLAEGEDLTVRDGRVHLKTTEGLRPVDVLLRRTDSGFCDPLELRSDSSLGVPGLVEAVYRQKVTLCNALGSGMVESPAMMAFLPVLCRVMLGEELRMPSVATWWCGQRRELDYVVTHLERLALRPAFSLATTPVRGATLSSAEKAAWIERLRRHPEDWVAQEAVALSTAPTWLGGMDWRRGSIAPRPVVMRVHACATSENPLATEHQYAVMPGGLTRTGASPRDPSVSMQQGGGSKDTWVLSSALEPPVPQLTDPDPGKIARGTLDLPSRLADNLFWMGRYLERSEDICRLLREALSRAAQGGELVSETAAIFGLFQRLAHLPVGAPLQNRSAQAALLRDVVQVNLSPTMGHGLAGVLASLQRVASVARDRLSLDTWRTIGALGRRLQGLTPPSPLSLSSLGGIEIDQLLSGLDGLITTLCALSGLAQESMTRGLGWRFMDIGRRVERALHGLDVLDTIRTPRSDSLRAALEVSLDVTDSQMTYRARYPAVPHFAPVVDLLLMDETNPRSVGFQVAQLVGHMDILSPDPAHLVFTDAQKVAIGLQAAIRTVTLEALAPGEEDGQRSLQSTTQTLREELYRLVNVLTRRYFVHSAETQQPHRLRVR